MGIQSVSVGEIIDGLFSWEKSGESRRHEEK